MMTLAVLHVMSACMVAGPLGAQQSWFDRITGRERAAVTSAGTTARAFDHAVADHMTPMASLITLSPEQPLRAAAQTLLDAKITGAPVVENGALVGVLSRTDLLYKLAGSRSLALAGQGPRSTRYMDNTARLMKAEAVLVRDAMTSNPISVTPQSTMQDAAAIMLRRKLNRIMVATKGGQLEGMVTASDVVGLILKDE